MCRELAAWPLAHQRQGKEQGMVQGIGARRAPLVCLALGVAAVMAVGAARSEARTDSPRAAAAGVAAPFEQGGSQEQRQRSRSAFGNLSHARSLGVARERFPSLMAPLWSGVGHQRVVRYAGDHVAVLATGSTRRAVQSNVPLRTRGSDGSEPLSTRLAAVDGRFVPANALAEYEIGGTLGTAVRFPTAGVTLRALGRPSSGQKLGDRVFWSNVASDTDVMIAALPQGAETFHQLRSVASPERLAFSVDLADGAWLRASGDAIEVVRANEMPARIESPTAFDADGRELPVSYRLTRAGFDILVAHRGRDVRYPLMVDPIVAVNPANWNAAGSASNFGGWAWSQCCPWRSMGKGESGAYGWGLYHFVYGSTYYDGGEWAAWRFKPPGDSYVQRSVYTNMRMSVPNGNRSVEQGIQRANGAWVPNGWWDDGIDQPAAYSGGSPWGTSVPFTAANREQHNPFPQAGDQAVTIFRVNSAGWTSNQPDQFYIGAATNYVGDDNAPYNVGETGLSETGAWQRQISNVNVYAADGGTGVRSIRMVAIDPDTGNDRWSAPERLQPCTPWCPAQNAAGSYVPLEAPEGISNLQVRAKDLVDNESRDRQIPVKVDRSGPDMSLRWGTMWDNRNSPFFNDGELHMWVTDGVHQGTAAQQRSGVKSVVLSIDDWAVVAGGNSSCAEGSCGASLDFTFVPSRWDAGRYTAKLTATDFAGNVSTDQWTAYIGYWASKEYGGANRAIDTDGERDAFLAVAVPASDAEATRLTDGLTPEDRNALSEYLVRALEEDGEVSSDVGSITPLEAADRAALGVTDSEAQTAAYGTYGCRPTHTTRSFYKNLPITGRTAIVTSTMTTQFCWNKIAHKAVMKGGADSRAIDVRISRLTQGLGAKVVKIPIGDTPAPDQRSWGGYPLGQVAMPRWFDLEVCPIPIPGLPTVACITKRRMYHTTYGHWDGTASDRLAERAQ
jgi:hypothetical protein